VGELWPLLVLYRPSQPLHDFGHAGLLGLVQRGAVENPHLPAAHATPSRLLLLLTCTAAVDFACGNAGMTCICMQC